MKPRYKERIPLKAPVIFTVGSLIGQGRVLDLTMPGCLIESPVAVKKGDYLQLKMSLPGLKSPLSVALGAVRWTKGSHFGVEFIKMDQSERQTLNRFMAQNLSLVSTRARREAFSDAGGQNWHLETYSAV